MHIKFLLGNMNSGKACRFQRMCCMEVRVGDRNRRRPGVEDGPPGGLKASRIQRREAQRDPTQIQRNPTFPNAVQRVQRLNNRGWMRLDGRSSGAGGCPRPAGDGGRRLSPPRTYARFLANFSNFQALRAAHTLRGLDPTENGPQLRFRRSQRRGSRAVGIARPSRIRRGRARGPGAVFRPPHRPPIQIQPVRPSVRRPIRGEDGVESASRRRGRVSRAGTEARTPAWTPPDPALIFYHFFNFSGLTPQRIR